MSDSHAALRRIVKQLRVELEWASRTGIDVTVAAPTSSPNVPLEDGEPLVPVTTGQPVVEKEAPAEETTSDEPPPAFAPDPLEAPPGEAPPKPVLPEQVRVRSAPRGRPWEQYLPGEGESQERPSPPPEHRGPPPEHRGAPPEHRGPPPDHRGPPPDHRGPPPDGGVPPFRPDPPSASEPAPHPRNAQSLVQVREILGDCRRCKLAQGRRNIVFGVGHPEADIMFVGEGPGQDEDRQGEPFVGKAGQLLTRIIEGGFKMRRGDVYIANIVKCRPPRNRDPEPDEVEACEPFLQAQIQQIQPRVIVALGKYAAQTLLRSQVPISRLRGKWHQYEGIDVMPTFHPAYVLRNESAKRPVWEDVKEVLRRLEEARR